MNLLVVAPARMVELVNILKKEFAQVGMGVIAAGDSNLMPGLYAADKAYLVPSVDADNYIASLVKICRQNRVKAILALTEKDMLAIAKAAAEFRKAGVIPLGADYEAALFCADELRMSAFLADQGYKGVPKARRLPDLLSAWDQQDNQLGEQEVRGGTHYDVDVYMDMISGKMVSIFAAEKPNALNGVSNKAISDNNEHIFALVAKLAASLGIVGPLAIEMIKIQAEYYIKKVQPGWGDSYPMAYACGVNFIPLIINNINGIENPAHIGNYESDIVVLSYYRAITKLSRQML